MPAAIRRRQRKKWPSLGLSFASLLQNIGLKLPPLFYITLYHVQ